MVYKEAIGKDEILVSGIVAGMVSDSYSLLHVKVYGCHESHTSHLPNNSLIREP